MSIIMRSTVERFAQILVVIWSLTALESAGNIQYVRMIFHRIVKEHFVYSGIHFLVSKHLAIRATLNVSVNILRFQKVEVSYGMNPYQLRQYRVQAMTQLRQR